MANRGVTFAPRAGMRALGIAAVMVALSACKGGGGFGHALGGLGHGLGHASSGLGHVASGVGHVAGHGGGAASGIAKAASHAGHGARGGGSLAGRVIRGGADVIDDVLDSAADLAIDNGTAVIVVDGVDADDPCMLAAAAGPACDDGYACVPRAGMAVCVPVDPTAPPGGGAADRAQVPVSGPTAPPGGGAADRAQVPVSGPPGATPPSR